MVTSETTHVSLERKSSDDSIYEPSCTRFWPVWLLLGGILLVVVVIALFLYFRGRRSDGLSRWEHCELDPMQAEILSMLCRNDGPVVQSEIVETTHMSSDDTAIALRELEDRGLAKRESNSGKQAYMVYAR
jgi:hypothetical protein